ncbi:MAG TPA: polyprenyl synthetase family protein [Spirochaetia bacterium]|nr:polyprenyl synthetase family protein [Spirochaetia bacterium]
MSRKSSIEQVYEPILRDLATVQRNIRKEIRTPNRVVNKIVAYIFSTKGKLLRPALAFLAGRAVGTRDDEQTHDTLVQLATAIELVHNASLVHDDILDGSAFRRHLPTLNRIYTNHIALLAGDALFSKAFYLMAHNLPKEVIEPITLVTEGMCHGELINSAQSEGRIDFDTYLTVVKLKTASLMSVSSQGGAMVTGADPDTIRAMGEYGMNVGIAYQLVDDYVDDEVDEVEGFSLDFAVASADRARAALASIPGSVYKDKMLSFVDLVLEMAAQKDMSATVKLP